MGEETLTLGDTEIEKNQFCHYKTRIFLGDADIKKVLASNNIYSGEKSYNYFIGYMYNGNKVKPLHIMIPKTSAYVKSYDGKLNGCIF